MYNVPNVIFPVLSSQQETKLDARREKEFIAHFGERKMTKKERRAAEEDGLF